MVVMLTTSKNILWLKMIIYIYNIYLRFLYSPTGFFCHPDL
jgi:hypothetical protein